MSKIGKILVAAALGCIATIAAARDEVPEEAGFNGFVRLGYSYNSIKSNEVAGLGIGSWDEFTPDSIDSIFDSPNGTSEGLPVFNFKLSYTLESRTEFFFGQDIVDAIRFDMTNKAGVRQEFGDKSNASLAYVFTGIPAKVWEDPFVERQTRAKTNRDSQGVRVDYNRILGSNADLQYTYRKIKIDTERSGQWLGLSPGQRNQLEREGNQHTVRFGYLFKLGDRDSLYPELTYTKDDRDGDAMKSDQWGVQLTYTNFGERYNLALTGAYDSFKYDKTHPIYLKTRDDSSWGVGATVFDKNLLSFLGKDWWATASGGYYKSDSNISFYKAELWSVGLGVMYRF